MSVRFTANEIKSNLKFLFTAALIISFITFVLQIVLIKYEKKSEQIYNELNKAESEISQYRNLIWLTHNYSNSYSSSFASEYQEVLESFSSSKIDLIQEDFPRVRAAVEGIGLEEYLMRHDHNTCVSLMSDARRFIEDYRIANRTESIELQAKVDAINMTILVLLLVMTFFFVYVMIYALYGK